MKKKEKVYMVWSPDRDGSRLDSFWNTKSAAQTRLKEVDPNNFGIWVIDEYDINVPGLKAYL